MLLRRTGRVGSAAAVSFRFSNASSNEFLPRAPKAPHMFPGPELLRLSPSRLMVKHLVVRIEDYAPKGHEVETGMNQV